MSAPGSKRTKQEEGKKNKSVRNAHLLSHTCCPDSQGSHREPCHRMAFGNRPANTHLFDGCTQPCNGLQGVVSHGAQRKGDESASSIV